METLLLPVSFSPDPPDGFPPQDTPPDFGDFAEVLTKQYFKGRDPLPEDPKISSGDPGASAMAQSFFTSIWVPPGIAFPQENPISDPGLTAPAAEEGLPATSPIELSSLLRFPQSSTVSEAGERPAIINGGKTIPLPDETSSPFIIQGRKGGSPTPPVFFPSGKEEGNPETSPGGEQVSEKQAQGIFPGLTSNTSGGQKAGPTVLESTLPPDSLPPLPSLEAPLWRKLAGKMEMPPEQGERTAQPTDSSATLNSSKETLPGESTAKIVMPLESGKTNVLSSDPQTSPVSSEKPLWEEVPGMTELSSGEEKSFIRPSAPQERNGSENKTVQGSNPFLAEFEPSLKMEVNPRIGEEEGPKRQEPFLRVVKEGLDAKNPQNREEREPQAGTQAYILDSLEKELGLHFSGKAGRGQEKALWTGTDVRPLPDGEIHNHPSFSGALSDPLNRQIENGAGTRQTLSSFSPRTEPAEVFQQVGQRVLWLIRHNEERIRITLDPPELGQVFLEIDRHKEHIKTVLWTDNPAAKARLETSQGEIQRIIESEGFKLEKFDVFVQQDPGWFQGRKENPRKPDSAEAGKPGEERASSVNSTESNPSRIRAYRPGSRSLDLFV